jgi:hypothetical protein
MKLAQLLPPGRAGEDVNLARRHCLGVELAQQAAGGAAKDKPPLRLAFGRWALIGAQATRRGIGAAQWADQSVTNKAARQAAQHLASLAFLGGHKRLTNAPASPSSALGDWRRA